MSTILSVVRADAKHLVELLNAGSLTSQDIIRACLDQIEKHDTQLHALISIPSRTHLLEVARKLDADRAAGRCKSSLHGVPVIIKVKDL